MYVFIVLSIILLVVLLLLLVISIVSRQEKGFLSPSPAARVKIVQVDPGSKFCWPDVACIGAVLHLPEPASEFDDGQADKVWRPLSPSLCISTCWLNSR